MSKKSAHGVKKMGLARMRILKRKILGYVFLNKIILLFSFKTEMKIIFLLGLFSFVRFGFCTVNRRTR